MVYSDSVPHIICQSYSQSPVEPLDDPWDTENKIQHWHKRSESKTSQNSKVVNQVFVKFKCDQV